MNSEKLVIPPPEIPQLNPLIRIEYQHPVLLRETVANKLSGVASALPEGLRIRIDSGYRSRDEQRAIWNYRLRQTGGNVAKTEKLVANPNKGVPPHASGGAIDVFLLDRDGNEINMSEPYAKYYDQPEFGSKLVSQKARKYRIILRNAMISEGFAPLDREYWHFSYGDENWAKYYNKKILYDEVVETPLRYKYGPLTRISLAVAKRFWRLVGSVFSIQTNY